MQDAGGEGLLLDGGADPPLPGQLLGRFRHRQGVLPFQGRTEATADFVVGEKGPSGHDQSLNATAGIGRVIRHAFKRISHLPFLSPKASLSIFIWSNQSNQKHRSWGACARRCRASTVPSPILTFAARPPSCCARHNLRPDQSPSSCRPNVFMPPAWPSFPCSSARAG